MAQLPDENKNNESIMDNMNNYETQNDESKIHEDDFDDNHSNQAAMDINDVYDQQMAMDDTIQHNALIQNRENAPPPQAQQGALTLDSLNQYNEMNPPQSKSAYTHGLMNAQRSDGADSSNQSPLGYGGVGANIMDGFAASQPPPEILIQNLIEMGFSREKSKYALQQVGNSVDRAISWLFENPTFEPQTFQPQDASNIVGTIQSMVGINANSDIHGTSPPNNSPDHGNNRGLSGNNGPFQKPVINNGYNNNNENILYDLINQTANNMSNMVGGPSKSKSNTVYSHSATLGSAATEHHDDEKNDDDTNNANNTDHRNNINDDNTLQKPTIETKTDEDDLQPLPTRIHHQATTSTVASEMTEISQLSTGIRSQSPSINNNTNTNTNNSNNTHSSKTKEQIAHLYQQQQILEATNRNTISNFMIPTDIKMVIVVRKDLGMKPGKVAAQCCHGCLGVVMDIINGRHISSSFNNNNNNNNNNNDNKQMYNLKELLEQWRMNGEKKIVLQCQNEEKLLELKQKAEINNLPHYLVSDAGHTQIARGSKTVVAIGPYPSIDIDQVTGGLKLY